VATGVRRGAAGEVFVTESAAFKAHAPAQDRDLFIFGTI
jgi:hypothetical protein